MNKDDDKLTPQEKRHVLWTFGLIVGLCVLLAIGFATGHVEVVSAPAPGW